MDRKLAAILAADIVGYSAQMERDEAGTFARLSERKKDIFEPEIARHGGRIFKTMGDGILAEFGSVVQAVECAVVLQAALEERNRDVPEDQAIRARIGINLGEVIVDGDDRYGEGVNIAARLEQLAEPGGICVSDKVAREVERKLAFGFVPMGPQKVKNIAEPVLVFRVTGQAGSRQITSTPRRRSRGVTAIAGILVALAVAVLAVFFLRQGPDAPPPREPPLTMAVLRFTNLTGDPGRDYLTVGIPEKIAVILGSTPVLRYGAFEPDANPAQQGGIQAVASDFRADLVLVGSFVAASPGLRFTGQVMDGTTGKAIHDIDVDVTDGDLWRLQFLIAEEAVRAVVDLTGQDASMLLDPEWAKTTGNAQEQAIILRAHALLYSSSVSGNLDSARLIDDGLRRFPDSVLLQLARADVHNELAVEAPFDQRWPEAEAAWEVISRIKDPETLPPFERWFFHVLRAQIAVRSRGDFDLAMRDAEAARAIVPYLPGPNMRLSWIAANAGRGDLALEWARVALNPRIVPPDWYRDTLAWALVMAGRPEEALAEFAQIWEKCLGCVVVAMVRSGRMDEARAFVADMRLSAPDVTIESEQFWPTGRQPSMAEPYLTEYLDDLRKAGLPETAPP